MIAPYPWNPSGTELECLLEALDSRGWRESVARDKRPCDRNEVALFSSPLKIVRLSYCINKGGLRYANPCPNIMTAITTIRQRLILCALFFTVLQVTAAPIARLEYKSEPGDRMGLGQAETLVDSPLVSPFVFSFVEGKPAGVVFFMFAEHFGRTNRLLFDTSGLGVPLGLATYPDTFYISSTGAPAGYAAVLIGLNENSCFFATGQFTVTNATFSQDNKVESFAASFEQYCDGTPGGMRGSFTYFAEAPAEIPEPSMAGPVAVAAVGGFMTLACRRGWRKVTRRLTTRLG